MLKQQTYEEKTDESLIGHCRGGDEAAAQALFLRYAPRLRSLARRYCTPAYEGRFDADDVVQSVFRVFFKGVQRDVYTVPPCGEIWALLMVLAINKVRSLVQFHSADKRAMKQTTPMIDSILQEDDSTATWLRMVFDEQLAGLPESNRQIVHLRMQNYEVAEIADKVQRSQRTVERALQDFRRRLSEA